MMGGIFETLDPRLWFIVVVTCAWTSKQA